MRRGGTCLAGLLAVAGAAPCLGQPDGVTYLPSPYLPGVGVRRPATLVTLDEPAVFAPSDPTARPIVPIAPGEVGAGDEGEEGIGTLDLPVVESPELEPGYRAVLATLVASGSDEAVRELAGLEVALLGDGGTRAVDGLTAGAARVAAAVARRDPEALLPIARLHHDAYVLYGSRRLSYLAIHARQMAETLARDYARKSRSPEATRTAAALLTSLGGHLQEIGSRASAERLFALALELEPAAPAALLGLGTLAEKVGDYEPAEKYLRRLVEAAPEDAEARLRLAAVLARRGGGREAAEQLRRARQIEGASWVHELVFQQLAALRGAEGDWVGAAAIFAEGRQALPESRLLALQQAYALDRAGRPSQALRLAHELTTAPAVDESPRSIYNRWPQRRLEEERMLLAASAVRAGPHLAAALGMAQPAEPAR